VTKLVLPCTIVPAVRDVPLADIDHAIERHGVEAINRPIESPVPRSEGASYPMAGRENRLEIPIARQRRLA
jgi:hypothetical protein